MEHKEVVAKIENKTAADFRFQTWIVITKNMQKEINSNKLYLSNLLYYICYILILIIVLIGLIIALDRHWNGYKEPWKNLYAFVNH